MATIIEIAFMNIVTDFIMTSSSRGSSERHEARKATRKCKATGEDGKGQER